MFNMTHIDIFLRHIQDYPDIFSTVCSPGIFITEPNFKHWQLEIEAYSKLCDILTRHIRNHHLVRTVYSGFTQSYSDILRNFVTFSHGEIWNIWNPGIFRTFVWLHPDAYQNSVIFTKINKSWKLKSLSYWQSMSIENPDMFKTLQMFGTFSKI